MKRIELKPDATYDVCPHTTNPRQLTSVCRRCVALDIIGASIYQLPQPLREYPIMTDHFKAMIVALKTANRESRKALRKCNEALAECAKARALLDKVKQNHNELKGEGEK